MNDTRKQLNKLFKDPTVNRIFVEHLDSLTHLCFNYLEIIYYIECEKMLRDQSLNYYSNEFSPERIAERRKILQKQFVEELRKYFYRGDLTNVSKENKISYNKIIRVMSGNSFDDRIIDILYEKAMNNKYSLECKMEVMITDLKS